jgi:hypothetical protein
MTFSEIADIVSRGSFKITILNVPQFSLMPESGPEKEERLSDSTIGIKIADGTYYPILQEASPSKKRLVLTTVRDEQAGVQIDLYKGDGPEIDAAVYIGSLTIEDLESSPKGEPEIEMVVGLDQEGNLQATAGDSRSGERQSLSVSMASIATSNPYDVPDFELEEEYTPDTGAVTAAYDQDDGTFGAFPAEEGEYPYGEPVKEAERKRSPLMMLAFVLLGFAVVVLIAYLLYRMFRGPVMPQLEAWLDRTDTVAVAEEPAGEPEAAPASPGPEEPEQGTARTDTVQPAETVDTTAEAAESDTRVGPMRDDYAAEDQPGTLRRTAAGVWYVIRWGDTLWDLSASFYRTPWKFGILARENRIQNPDLIYAGDDLFIPEQ